MAADDNPRLVLDLLIPPAALLPHSPTPYITLMLVGFVVGILGHLTRARWLIAAGVILIFLGTPLERLRGDLATVIAELGYRRDLAPEVRKQFDDAIFFPLLANVTSEDRPPPIEESRGDSGE